MIDIVLILLFIYLLISFIALVIYFKEIVYNHNTTELPFRTKVYWTAEDSYTCLVRAVFAPLAIVLLSIDTIYTKVYNSLSKKLGRI